MSGASWQKKGESIPMTLFDFLHSPEQQQFDNSVALIQCIEQWIRLSRTDAARLCRLNAATMTHLSASLLARGLLRERGKAQSAAGRKPTFLELEPTAGHSVVLHLMPEGAQLTLHNLHHETVAARQLPPLAEDADPDEYLRGMLRFSAFSAHDNGILGGCIICGHDYIPDPAQMERLHKAWQERAAYPIYLTNAASMTCLAESRLRCPNQDATLLTLSIARHQVSTGVLLGSQLLFSGFRPGLMSRAFHDDLCLNSLSLRAYQHDAAMRGAVSYSTMELLSSPAPYGELCSLASAGNADAAQVISSYAASLAEVIVDLLRLYQPDILLLDGEILSYMEAIHPALHARLLEIAATPLPNIHTPFLGRLACACGASRLCVRRALENIPLAEKEDRP